MSTAHVCGCHIHLGVPDSDTGVEVINHVRPWLPAVSANSPFAEGADTGYASWRYLAMSRRPSGDPPPYAESAGRYEEMARSGAIMDPGNCTGTGACRRATRRSRSACATWRRRNGRRRCSRRASPPRRSPGSGTGWTRRGCRRRWRGPTSGARRGTAWTGPASTPWTGGARAAAGRGAAAPGRRGE
ncbi:glutamate-cysteine ligase family protein [Amycolatopsis thermoflava]|uniref:glutamate-cysteine ligase family protein n=1 Tax=Amycolatopsis thermoflava TaxID=84480 RepID=UPI003658049B